MLLALWRRAKGAVLRALAFALLLLWLAGPRLVRETREGLPDIGLLVVDQTASMQVNGRAALAEAARAAIRDEARQFHDLDLRTITVPEKGDAGTLLFGAIERAVGEIPRSRLAGIVAITDGQIHDVPKAVPGGVPLNVLIPAQGEETDRRMRIIEAPGFGIVGKPVTIRARGRRSGRAAPAARPTLTLRRDGEPPQRQHRPDRPRAANRDSDHPLRAHGRGTVGQSSCRARSRPSTTAPWSRSTACATGCACC